MTVMLVNPGGGMRVYDAMGRKKGRNRLDAQCDAVRGAGVDVIVMPEARLDSATERVARTYVGRAYGGEVAFEAAPTSAAAARMEMGDATVCVGEEGAGIVCLLGSRVATAVEFSDEQRNFVSGRILWVRLRVNSTVLNIVGVYGVSSPMSTPRKRRVNKLVSEELRRVLAACDRRDEPTLLLADMNTVEHPHDRRTGQLHAYDTNEHAIWRTVKEYGYTATHAARHPARVDFTYTEGGVGVSKIDAIFANRRLLAWGGGRGQWPIRSAVAGQPEPFSPDHRAEVLHLPGPFLWEKGGAGGGSSVSGSALGPGGRP